LKKVRSGKLKTAGLIRYILFFSLAIMSLFMFFGLSRGANELTLVFRQFIGYTLASYNRMTALLRGTMHYPYSGRGVYLSPALLTNHFFDYIFPLKNALSWPESLDLWNSEFQAPESAGLNPYLIWSGAFGYLFSDFGWLTPLILLVYGVIYGFIWRQAKSGMVFGIMLYPWLAFSALTWFSYNVLFDYRFPFFILAALVLMAYEKLLSASEWRNWKVRYADLREID
jgi:hypothetical protein